MDLTLFLLHHKIFPRLGHVGVFGAELARAAATPQGGACPRCGTKGAFRTREGSSAGWCAAGCGRVGWWMHLMRGRNGDAAFAEAARLAGVPARLRGGLDLGGIQAAEGFGDVLEALMARAVEAARGAREHMEGFFEPYGVTARQVEGAEVGLALDPEQIAEVLAEFAAVLVDRALAELKLAGLLEDGAAGRTGVVAHRDRMGMAVGVVGLVAPAGEAREMGRRGTGARGGAGGPAGEKRVRRAGGMRSAEMSGAGATRGPKGRARVVAVHGGAPADVAFQAGAGYAGAQARECVVVTGDALEVLMLAALGMPAVGVREETARRALGTLQAAGTRTFIVLTSPDRGTALGVGRALVGLPDTAVHVLELDESAVSVAARNGAEAVGELVRGATPLAEADLAEATRGLEPARAVDRGMYLDAVRELERRVDRGRDWPRVAAAAARALGISGVELARELRLRDEDEARRTGLERWRELVEEVNQRLVAGDAEGLAELFRKAASDPVSGTAAPESLDVSTSVRQLERAPAEVLTGYPDLDDIVRVLPTELVLVAARPSHGKTTFGLNVLLNVLRLARLAPQPRPSILFSYEVQREFLVGKLLSALTGRYSFHDVLNYLRSGDRDDPIVEEARERLAGYAGLVHAVTEPSLPVDGLVAYCRRVAEAAGGLGMVIVDYLQIIPIAEPTISKDLQVTRAVKALRTAAQELQVPVICLAQVNPPFSREEEPRPLLAHLVESTAIEQECNTIMMLYNETVHRAQWELAARPTEGEVVPLEVIIRKHKYGAINRTILLDYRMRTNEIRQRGGFSRVYEV